MEDNSFFQFYYEFKNKTLVKSRLAYYPSPSIIKEDIDELEDYEIHANPLLSELYYEMMSEMVYNSGSLSSNSHIRFDYDSSAKSHKKAHLQFGGINNFRITAKSIILPFTFVEKLLLDFQASWFNENIDFNKMNVERNHGVKKCYSFDESDVFFIQS